MLPDACGYDGRHVGGAVLRPAISAARGPACAMDRLAPPWPIAAADAALRRLQQERIRGQVGDRILLVEHPEIVTVGRRAQGDRISLPPGFPSFAVDRGGGLTWHGPGQLTIYPIVAWTLPGERSVLRVIERLEDWLLAAFSRLGIPAVRDGRMRGAWVAGHKVASIGLAFDRWVTRHGLSINYATPPGRVEQIACCGLPPGTTTSLAALGIAAGRHDFEKALRDAMPGAIGRVANSCAINSLVTATELSSRRRSPPPISSP